MSAINRNYRKKKKKKIPLRILTKLTYRKLWNHAMESTTYTDWYRWKIFCQWQFLRGICQGNEITPLCWPFTGVAQQFDDSIAHSATTSGTGTGTEETSTISSFISGFLSSAMTPKNISSASLIHSYRQNSNASFTFSCKIQVCFSIYFACRLHQRFGKIIFLVYTNPFSIAICLFRPALELLGHLQSKHESFAASFQGAWILSTLAFEVPNSKGNFLKTKNKIKFSLIFRAKHQFSAAEEGEQNLNLL